MKFAAITCSALFVLGALLSVIQLWFEPMSAGVFIKTLVTLVIAFFVVLGIALVRREYLDNKKMKEDGYLD